MPIDDRNILVMISKGEERAFHEFFVSWYPKILAFLTNLLHDKSTAEDLSQDIFLKVWLMRPLLPEIKSINSYLYRMSKNAALNYLRCIGKEVPLLKVVKEDEAYIEDIMTYRQKLDEITAAIKSMPQKRREAFVLNRIMNIPNDLIAKRMNVSKKTVENHINLAMKELRKISLGTIFFNLFI